MIRNFENFKREGFINENINQTKKLTLTIGSEFDSGYAEYVEDTGAYDNYSKKIRYYSKDKYEYIEINNLTLSSLIEILNLIEDSKDSKDNLEYYIETIRVE